MIRGSSLYLCSEVPEIVSYPIDELMIFRYKIFLINVMKITIRIIDYENIPPSEDILFRLR